MPDITVITPSIPSRSVMLAEARESVKRQTLAATDHLVHVDELGDGPAAIRNSLLLGCTTAWVAFLDDDDLLDPEHLEILAANSDGHDVIGSYCRFTAQTIPDKFCNRPYDRDALRQHGIFPITILARTSAIFDAGMFGNERYEDWALWNRMADNGCSFHIVPQITWTYRLGHGNRTNAA